MNAIRSELGLRRKASNSRAFGGGCVTAGKSDRGWLEVMSSGNAGIWLSTGSLSERVCDLGLPLFLPFSDFCSFFCRGALRLPKTSRRWASRRGRPWQRSQPSDLPTEDAASDDVVQWGSAPKPLTLVGSGGASRRTRLGRAGRRSRLSLGGSSSAPRVAKRPVAEKIV